MRALTRLLLGGALATAALVTPAVAAENCVGDDLLFYVCVITPEPYKTEITRCIYAGGPTCQDVSVPFVGLYGEAGYRCGGVLNPSLCDRPAIIDPGIGR